jgi:cellulose synthase (UDP-forming)
VTAPALAARGKHHRRTGLVLPDPPDDQEKASYGWRSLPFLAAALAVSAACIFVWQLWMEISHPVLAIFCLFTAVYAGYQLLSLPAYFGGRSFDLSRHVLRVRAWRPASFPDVDIYLPICAEPTAVLRNTWSGVFELMRAYPGVARAYVLDDGPSDEAAAMAESFGFAYLRRPDPRQHRKAGNLNYAFGRTCAPFLVVFDADFRPRADFLAETLPYLDDATVGIVQTPQFFRVSPGQTWVEQAAGPILEVFYRVVQVSRDRFGSALCVGSNAVYRRAALAPTGGFTQTPYAEDSHSGLDARYNGYRLAYLPVPLAAGMCPASLDAFMRQQYRRCCGATSLIWTNHMWRVPMPRLGRLPYIAGWLWNLMAALRTLMLPLIPVVLLAYLPGEIRLRNALFLVPVVLVSVVLYPLWHNSPYSPRTWPLSLAAGWAQVLGIWDFARHRVRPRAPSREPSDATRRFWWAVTIWNGGLGLVWLALAAWRTAQTGSVGFGVIAALGLFNLVVVGRLIVPGRSAE